MTLSQDFENRNETQVQLKVSNCHFTLNAHTHTKNRAAQNLQDQIWNQIVTLNTICSSKSAILSSNPSWTNTQNTQSTLDNVHMATGIDTKSQSNLSFLLKAIWFTSKLKVLECIYKLMDFGALPKDENYFEHPLFLYGWGLREKGGKLTTHCWVIKHYM